MMVRWLQGKQSDKSNIATSTLRLLFTVIKHDGDLMEKKKIKLDLNLLIYIVKKPFFFKVNRKWQGYGCKQVVAFLKLQKRGIIVILSAIAIST